ncbi:hypothetical protein HS7_13620 [Sulfolobales archaeon HS-7]|nr:hypothetical protein HS7_13620 [Sulfolobales archaeon HS-7]
MNGEIRYKNFNFDSTGKLTTIREQINKILWSEKDKLGFKLVVIDRKAAESTSLIDFSVIDQVDRHYIYLTDGNVIPLHRVIEIRRGESPIWRRRSNIY